MSPFVAHSLRLFAGRDSARGPGIVARLLEAIGQSFVRHRAMAVFVLLYLAAAMLVEWHLTGSVTGALYLYVALYLKIIPAMLGVMLFFYPLYIALVLRPARPMTLLLQRLRDSVFTIDRIATALPPLLLLPIFLNSFTVLKSAVGLVAPFRWDVRFEIADRWLHGGEAPWRLLQPLLGEPRVSQIVTVFYVLWFLVLWFVLVWQIAGYHDRRLRAQFLGSMMACWSLLGTGAAMLFSSAGPCYFGRVTGLEDPYAPLMGYLREANASAEIWSLITQEKLWGYFTEGTVGLGGGISAMPSMHLSMAFLFVLLGWRVHRLIGLAALLYCVAIQIGSVHLGWHYAVDGYVSIAATAAIWWAMGRILDRREAGLRAADPRPGPASPNNPLGSRI